MQKRIPVALMRGGTSKGAFFMDSHLPSDPVIRDRVILQAYGSPDPHKKQINGIGGGTSVTSKVAIISSSANPAYDVVYQFGQVAIDQPVVDYNANCGNISSAVGPFAVDRGLVAVKEPITRVRIHQKNTDKLIVAEVPVTDGRYNETGDYGISGVPGTGGKITLRFFDPGGSVTGRLFPTGNRSDRLNVDGVGNVSFTFMDAANPVVMVPAEQLGLSGTEIDEIDEDSAVLQKIEAIRCAAAVAAGMAETPEEAGRKSQTVPKIALVAAPRAYTALNGQQVHREAIDLVVRYIAMGTLHRAIAVSGAIAAAGALKIEGTAPFSLAKKPATRTDSVMIGHPGGIIDVGAHMEETAEGLHYKEAVIGRTARCLMEGYVLLPERCFR